MVKNVCGIDLEFDDKFATYYEEILSEPLSNMVEYYLKSNAKTLDIKKAIQGKTKIDLQDIVITSAKEELFLNGEPYRD